MSDHEGRPAELARNLAVLRERIAAACAAAGRDAASVSLLAVTKTVPASDVAALLDLGVTAFGENRAQEAATKAGEVAELRRSGPGGGPEASPRWHFVGGLQRNKVNMVLPWVTRVESVDSPRLARALDRAATAAVEDGSRTGPLPVLLQYSVDGDPERGGVPDDGLLELADLVGGLPGLRLDGLMAVAPLGAEPDGAFSAIAGAAQRLRERHPGATAISAGMSGDLESAVGHGSTVVRVGTALVGDRRIASR